VSSRKGKGKAKAVVTPVASDDEEAVEDVLEYDEAVDDSGDDSAEIDESEDSGSEFHHSENEEYDSEDEEIMVDAAVRMSLQTISKDGAGPSSGKKIGPGTEAMIRAVAAERRLARQGNSDDEDFDIGDLDSSDEEPLAKGKLVKKFDTDTAPKSMTMSELKQQQRERRKATAFARMFIKKEERELVKRLGRRLTYVSLSG